MSKAGRKPINAERYPSGRVKPPSVRNYETARASKHDNSRPAQIKRAVDKLMRDAEEPNLGSSLGRMLVRGQITPVQFAGGEAYAKLRGRFDRATEVPRRMAQSPSYGDARSSCSHEFLTEKAYAALVERHNSLIFSLGYRFTILDRVCVDDSYIAEDERKAFLLGLDMLAVWFDLGKAS